MDGLIRVALIKSAKFDFAEVDLNGNSLFIGANGAGKTTLLRAILYFYTADARTLGISSAKKISFSDYYFEEEESYIVYIYKKDEKYILVTLYKDATIKFRFCVFDTMPNIREMFVENSKPIIRSKLWIELKKTTHLSNIMNSSEYKKVLYTKSQKHRELSLFEANEYDGFVKTLSNIFINSKVDSEAIKKVIVSSLDVDKKIDIQSIKRQLEKFNSYYEDIVIYEKNIDNIKKVVDRLDKYERCKNNIQENFSTLANSKNIVIKMVEELKTQAIVLQKEKNRVTQTKEKEKSLNDKRTEKLSSKIAIIKEKISVAKKKKEHYNTIEIEQMIREYSNLNTLKDELKLTLQEQEFLTKEHQELESSHNNQLQSINNSFDRQENELNAQKDSAEVAKIKKESKLKDTQRDEIEVVKKSFSVEFETAKDSIHNKLLEIQEKDSQLKDIKRLKFEFEAQDDIELKSENIKTITQKIVDLKEKMKLEDTKLEQEKKLFDKDMKALILSRDKNIDKIEIKISSTERLINPHSSSLTHKLYSNNLDVDKYLFFLKDEVLDSHLEVDIGSVSSEIFELNFLDFKAPSNTLTQELKKSKSIKKDIEDEFISEKKSIENSYRNFENGVYRVKKELDETIKKSDMKLSTLKNQLSTLENKKRELSESFMLNIAQRVKNIKDELLTLKALHVEFTEMQKGLKLKENSKISATKASFTKMFNELEKRYQSSLQEFESLSKKIEEKKATQIDAQKLSYKQLMQDKNVDVNRLTDLSIKENNLESEIKKVQDFQIIIIGYYKDKEEYIDFIKKNEKEFKEEGLKLLQLKEEFSISQKSMEDKLSSITNSTTQNSLDLSSNEGALKRVIEFENSSIMSNSKSMDIDYEPNDSYDELDSIMSSVISLISDYAEIEKDISSRVGRLSKLFDNTLFIKRDLDSIVSAYTLKEFHTNNKISHFKELQATSLKLIVKSSIEQYDNLITHSSKIESLVKKITKLFQEISIGVVEQLSLRYSSSNNKIIEQLSTIKALNLDSPNGFDINLFNDNNENAMGMVEVLKILRDMIEENSVDTIKLEDSFVLEFRVVENGNDSRYQTSLDMIGSNGTDVLVKSMIYIAMLHIFKTKTTKKELFVNVILDEIGILSQRYLKELIEFANKYGIYFINGAPDEKLIGTYKTVSLIRNIDNRSVVQELISR